MTKFTNKDIQRILRNAERVICSAQASLGRDNSAQSTPALTPEQQAMYERMERAFSPPTQVPCVRVENGQRVFSAFGGVK